jgi:adenosylmethionine-8-amino-7-oxononanoate aminotransferase
VVFPPLAITADELDFLMETLLQSIDEVVGD